MVALLALGLYAPAASRASTSLSSQSVGWLGGQVASYAGPVGPLLGGVWASADTTCWGCDQGGPSTAAATAYMRGGRSAAGLLDDAGVL